MRIGLFIAFLSVGLIPFANANVSLLCKSEYLTLYKVCQGGGGNAYVGVNYGGKTGCKTFNHGECYPYKIGSDLAQMAVFCKSVTCENNPNPNCTGGAVPPVPVPIPAGATLPNVLDFVQLLGQGATCRPNEIPV